MGSNGSTDSNRVNQDTVAEQSDAVTNFATPICVDLDGSLVRSDTLFELFIVALLRAPFATLRAVFVLLANGKAAFKDHLSSFADIDCEKLPYREDLVDWLTVEKAKGRPLVLATASHHKIADGVAEHLGIFDEVLASNAEHNLKGINKANILVERYGRGEFCYVGDHAADIAVWNVAGSSVVAGASSKVRSKIDVPIEAQFANRSVCLSFFKALRTYQWAKNLLIFVPVITATAIFEVDALLGALVAFICFSITASGVYLVNDLTDLNSDRAHPEKRHRPFASGHLSLAWGLVLGPGMIVAGGMFAFVMDFWLGAVIFVYFIATTAYSFYLKTQPLVDVFTLAFLYSLRVFAGGVASGYMPSIWLLSFSGFLFLSLAFLKRYVEISERERQGKPADPRRGYLSAETLPLYTFGTSSAFAAVIVLSLYVELSGTLSEFTRPDLIWAMVPLVLFWLLRLWLAAYRGYVHHDPIVYTAKDWVSRLVFIPAILIYVLSV